MTSTELRRFAAIMFTYMVGCGAWAQHNEALALECSSYTGGCPRHIFLSPQA